MITFTGLRVVSAVARRTQKGNTEITVEARDSGPRPWVFKMYPAEGDGALLSSLTFGAVIGGVISAVGGWSGRDKSIHVNCICSDLHVESV